MSRLHAGLVGALVFAWVVSASAQQADAAGRATGPAWTQDPICVTPPVTPDVRGAVYASPAGSTPLTVDVYEATGSGSPPSLMIVHGGSWKSGCRGSVSDLADRFRLAGFTVFDIAYRTDCKATRPPSTLDDPTYCKGIGIPYETDDLQAAVLWIRQNADAYGADPNRLAAIGPSTGGHLVYLEAVLNAGTTAAPDAVAGWSGAAELRVFADGSSVCAVGKCQARRKYIGCLETACPTTWDSHSAYSVATAMAPPAFVANSTTEIASPYQAAVDYHNKLDSLGVGNELCSVPGNHHGQALADFACSENGVTAFDATVAFLMANV